MTELVGRLLGVDSAVQIGRIEPSLAAPWAHDAPAWLLLGLVGLVLLAAVFYSRLQHVPRATTRFFLTVLRASVWCLLLCILAEPVVTVRITSQSRPSLWVLLDGTESMALADDLPPSERDRLASAVGWTAEGARAATGATTQPTRCDYVKALLEKQDDNLLKRLEKRFRLRFFLLDRADGVRGLEGSEGSETRVDPAHVSEQLTTDGQVTALGSGLIDLARRQSTTNLAGLVVFSDFNQNAGPSAVEAAKRLGAAIYTVGVGPAAAVDLAVDLQCPPTMKKDERYPLVATLRQEGLAGQAVTVKFTVAKIGQSGEAAPGTAVDQRDVKLNHSTETVETAYVPQETGRFLFRAEVEPLREEVVTDNNRAQVETTVHDNFLRLLFVEQEPTWEWRFVKEVFHRDRLVGTRGFRTFLRSADPKVRQSSELFVPTLTPPRSEFFTHDVILLGDVPASALSPRFCQMVEEFVGKLGGGLVVVSGPRFGPGQLALTPLADMLPVKVDPNLRVRDRQPFRLARTAEAGAYDFMQLGPTADENDAAWNNLGPLPWYQPVERLHSMATALAVHPSELCVDGKTPQPVIAARLYGRGEVVYLAFNEIWRLRRLWGERYYRQFWGQLIHRLASRHALGSQKRFVVRTDRKQYRADDQVLLTVEAYDADFKPLAEDKIPGRKLSAELVLPGRDPAGQASLRPLSIAQLREGVFEARLPVFAEGEHRVRVRDPITRETVETTFQVAAVSVERQRATRNAALEQSLADATGGKDYDLVSVAKLPDEVRLVSRTETNLEVLPLWNTWLVFALVAALMLGEWLVRKWVNLP
jgi:hypothetical protein